MKIIQEIESIQGLVKKLLEEDSRFRDNDRILCLKIWSIQLGGFDVMKKSTAYQFMTEYAAPDTQLIKLESIGRARRRVQQKYPHLRGLSYGARQNQSEEVKAALGFMMMC